HDGAEGGAGGPLALVETGDRVRLSVKNRTLDLLVDAAELERRRALWKAPVAPKRGWDKLMFEQVLQAPDGADLAFLRPEGV
ncbi:MAG: dihydroxy-acid dehydratase, partial [Acetobacteraceae bacterium]